MKPPHLDDLIPSHVADQPFPEEFPPGHPLQHLAGKMGAILAFAIVQTGGVILFETGIGRPTFPTVSSKYGARLLDHYNLIERPIEVELGRHGIRLEDVRAIVNSHLHFDHCGGNPLFPGVPIYVQAAEHRAARLGGRDYTVPEWIDFPGVEYVVIDGDAVIAKGITAMSTPGHTPGHQSLIVDTEDGLIALAGQAIYLKEEYEQIAAGGPGYGGVVLAEQTPVSARRLIDARPTRVHFSHDLAVWTP